MLTEVIRKSALCMVTRKESSELFLPKVTNIFTEYTLAERKLKVHLPFLDANEPSTPKWQIAKQL